MTKSEAFIRSILGPVRMDIRPLAYAVDITIDLLFCQGISSDDIFVTKSIYPDVAKRFVVRNGRRPSVSTISRRIERLADFFWDTLISRGLFLQVVGSHLEDLREPRAIIVCIAVYVHLGQSYCEAFATHPELISHPAFAI